MQFLALIYEDESRFAQGYDEAEFAEYGVFGKKHAGAIKGGNALQPTPTAKTVNTFRYPGATPSISSNQSQNAILWAVENTGHAILYAYNATTLQMLYNSDQAANERDHFGAGNKFITPVIINGKVYVGTTKGVGVFGLLSDPK